MEQTYRYVDYTTFLKGNDTHIFFSFTSLKQSAFGQIRSTEIKWYGFGTRRVK
ncbi:hypothetical protein [Lentibacillus sp. Marseille-P4043]|uniref:hypothetical protein n=1 Tax=Lentibacillus sp. Marseille-P4043 TaxID=2040293 RepID=UPI00131A5D67|nr:hypothetical protein [Lentibacillus sp. Marseille-P4043]